MKTPTVARPYADMSTEELITIWRDMRPDLSRLIREGNRSGNYTAYNRHWQTMQDINAEVKRRRK